MFNFLDDDTGGSNNTRLENLASIILGECPDIVSYIPSHSLHIHILWVIKVLASYFSETSAFHGNVVEFRRDVVTGMNNPPVTVENTWITLQ